MFGNAFTGWHALILLAIILLLFGAPKLPALARSLGQSMKIFKSEIKNPEAEKSNDKIAADPNSGDQSAPQAHEATSPEQAPGSQSQPKP